ncbi:unnamed protein product [Pieris macdunnoughi]|uniref:Tudor domain-containing protein n=1 Tax=Pieris macdunnoughi TaxID=345717 RepID=A0A821WLJ6_9NEOP|nr:unnamed protein product [Pieris macdunnoughi]
MALPPDMQRSFRLFVTHVDGEGFFLKISGQLDQQSSMMIESLLKLAVENLESGIGAIPPGTPVPEGVVCAAKYKDGIYYRAKILSIKNIANGLVGVHFIDYGNKDTISLSTIRYLNKYDPMLLQIPGQASDYYLSRLIHESGCWDERLLLKLQSLLCYAEYPATIDANTRTIPVISIQFKGNDLSNHLVTNKFGMALPLEKQEFLLLQVPDNQLIPNWSPTLMTDSPAYPEHVPFLLNQNFPNPATAMRQNASVSYSTTIPPPSMVAQRLLVNRASRNTVNLKAPIRQPQQPFSTAPAAVSSTSVTMGLPKTPSPKKSNTYKSRLLEINSTHKVFVSYAEEGPELFAVQLAVDAIKLQEMMDDINRRPHSSLTEPPMIGTVCLGRMSGDRIICRAIVMNLSGSQCKLFFVDFGDTEMVSYYDIFDIPEEFVKPNVFAMRFCLSGVKNLEKGPHLNEAFKQLVNGKLLSLRVVAPEGPPLIQYGELYVDNRNVLDLLMANMKDKLQFKWLDALPQNSKQSVLVSYVDSCIKFYIQLSDNIDTLNAVMEAVKNHCENTSSPGPLPIGSVCCARFPEDANWYRAIVRDTKGERIIVAYVDYGNEQEVAVADIRTITPDLIQLPAQAMKCALKGYEDKAVESKTSNQLEMLALEKTLMVHVVGMYSHDTMLVTLVDDTVSPPLDIARRMNQLSQPRSTGNVEKASPPIRKEAPEFSSPEGSVPDDGRKKSFRREKSFKDERKRDGDEEFGQRGGSFRGRDQKDGFDRSGSGRFGDKLSKPDRGDRRGGRRENQFSPQPASAEESWEDSSTPSVQSPPLRQNRENHRDKRKSRPDERQKGHKKESSVGRRLRQATEVAQAHKNIQDRLKRERFYQQDDDNKPEERNRFQKFDRRENRGERRDNWGDKKENWHQNREFKDRGDRDYRGERGDRSERGDRGDRGERGDRGDRGERGDRGDRGERGDRSERGDRGDRGERGDRGGRGGRGERGENRGDRYGGRSNFSPRDRADRSERSFGSDDKRFEKRSYNDDRAGRVPYKNRSFTFKELTDPVSLDTPFTEPSVEIGSQQEVSVTWIISPENFYTQILSLQAKFLEMMHKIPQLYKGVKSYTGDVPVGASVLARYPADGVLYRATVVGVQPFSKFIVRYIDFGNKQLVDAKDIWQLERELMELPKMAVHCALVGVAPTDGEWKANPEIDLCFNAPRYQCIFQEFVDEQYKVSLWNNGVNIADSLVEKGLATLSEHQSSVTLKDEAIDLTIIVGQQILCRVTHVESYEKFYVQLDLDKADLVESAIANFDVNKLTPIADRIMDGIHCTVRHEGKIYRAILGDVSDSTSVEAVLPDYGKTIRTSAENIMILPPELSVYYYQSLQCSLNNYTADSKILIPSEELKDRLVGNTFIIYINDVDGICLISTLYEPKTGEKVAIFEPDEGAYDEVVPLCTRAVFNYNFGMAFVSHLENLNEFYLQRSSDSDKIAQLLDQLYKFYEEGTPESLTSFEADTLCVAKSADGNWYRANVLSATDDEAKVQYSDYGNSETVQKQFIKKMDPKFYEPCCLALVASLGLVALQDDTLAKFQDWTNDKEVQVTLAFGSDGWLANLNLDGVDLSLKLIEEKLAATQVETAPIEEVQPVPEPVQPVSLPEGCAQVYISHIDSPGHFWLQMADKVDKIEEIQAELQANIESYPEIESREIGTLCVAKYSADDQWYRAEILDSDSDITTVRFVDYGNTDVLDNQPGLIKVIPEQLKAIERFAIKSSVNAVPTGTGQWSEPSSDYFTGLVGDLSLPVDALIVLKDVTTYVDIFVNGQNITDKLVSDGHATRSEQTECGDLPSCFASHVNSPSEFWIQLETATPELQAMEAAMVDAENFPPLESKEEGLLCAAKYPEDGAWYRAQVIVDGSEGTEVLFMDYGNASMANELRSLPDDLKTRPALSRKCALQKPREIKSWSRRSEIKFNELAAEGATIFNVQFIASGDISIIELFLEGKSVTEELVGLCEEQPASERPSPVGQDLLSNGKICYVNTLNEFYVQLDDSGTKLDKVTESLDDGATFEAAPELKVGSVCAAFWVEDAKWYRAKILEFCDVGSHVQFIDYGNKSKCVDFRQLPEDLSTIEPLAKSCRLAGLTEESATDETAKAKLEDYVVDLATFQIEFLDSTTEPSLVKLLLNGEDVISLLFSENKIKLPVALKAEETNAADDFGSPRTDLDESMDSAKTVIENTLDIDDKENDNPKTETILETISNKDIASDKTNDISEDKETNDLKVSEKSEEINEKTLEPEPKDECNEKQESPEKAQTDGAPAEP